MFALRFRPIMMVMGADGVLTFAAGGAAIIGPIMYVHGQNQGFEPMMGNIILGIVWAVLTLLFGILAMIADFVYRFRPIMLMMAAIGVLSFAAGGAAIMGPIMYVHGQGQGFEPMMGNIILGSIWAVGTFIFGILAMMAGAERNIEKIPASEEQEDENLAAPFPSREGRAPVGLET